MLRPYSSSMVKRIISMEASITALFLRIHCSRLRPSTGKMTTPCSAICQIYGAWNHKGAFNLWSKCLDTVSNGRTHWKHGRKCVVQALAPGESLHYMLAAVKTIETRREDTHVMCGRKMCH